MKKGVKITLWIVGVLAFLVLITWACLDVVASRFVQKEVRKSFENIPEADALVGDIYVDLLSGSAIVRDITFCTNSLALEDSITGKRQPGLAIHIPTLAIWNINYVELLRQHSLSVLKVTIDEPKILIYLDEKNPESILPNLPEDKKLDKADEWLKKIDVRFVELRDLRAKFHSTRTPLSFSADGLSFECRDLHYDLEEKLFTYNDSVYRLSLQTMLADIPDGWIALEVHDLETRNQGALKLGRTNIHNTISPKQMADLQREPITWIDIDLNKLTTSPFNPLHKVLDKDYSLDALNVDVKRMHVCQDERYAPKAPTQTPQEFLRKLPVVFSLKKVEAKVHQIDIEFSSTDINCGQMHMKNMQAKMLNVTNKRGAKWSNSVKGHFGTKGQLDAQFNMVMDKASTFEVKINGQDIETHDINSFIRPLVGMTCDCHINQLDAAYTGDKNIVKGTFCMQYHGVKVQVYKEDDIPYKVITKNASTITNMANNLVTKSNPSSVDPRPREYEVEWKRDPWKQYPLFVFGPCIDGVVKTMLPGLFVHKQTKKKKKN